MSSDERRLQTRGVEWLKAALPHVMVVAVPNEQAASVPRLSERLYAVLAKFGMLKELEESIKQQRMIRIMNLKRMGMRPGAADLFIFWAVDSVMHCAALETKDKAYQSPNQAKFQAAFEAMGGKYFVWRNLRELEEACVALGLQPSCPTPEKTPYTKKQMQFNMLHELNKQMYAKDKKNDAS